MNLKDRIQVILGRFLRPSNYFPTLHTTYPANASIFSYLGIAGKSFLGIPGPNQ